MIQLSILSHLTFVPQLLWSYHHRIKKSEVELLGFCGIVHVECLRQVEVLNHSSCKYRFRTVMDLKREINACIKLGPTGIPSSSERLHLLWRGSSLGCVREGEVTRYLYHMLRCWNFILSGAVGPSMEVSNCY